MSAADSLRAGDLERAKGELQDLVRKEPANTRHRVFLFQLLAVMGEWERALTQLNVLGDMDAGMLPMVHLYGQALRCEVLRAEIFAGTKTPVILGEPEPWMAALAEALRLFAEGRVDQAQALRDQSFDDAPAVPGIIDDQPFQWLADGDARLGPVLEVIINGRYYWAPFQRIRELQLEKPSDLRDFVWAPARFMWANGGDAVGLIPTRYPGSELHEASSVRLARRTEWFDRGGDCMCGIGQRMLTTDQGEHPILDIRQVRLDAPPEVASRAEPPTP